MQQILSIVIKASQDFIRHSDEDLKENAPVLNNFYEFKNQRFNTNYDLVNYIKFEDN